MYLYNALSKTILAFFAFMFIFTSAVTAKELTQQERNEMAAKLIPIITMLLMDDGDKVAPVLTLRGDSNVSVVKGSTFNDDGAVAVDNKDGNITNKITLAVTGNTEELGSYTVTYSIVDSSGNKASVKRTVNVVPFTGTVTLNDGNNTLTIDTNNTQILDRNISDSNTGDKIITLSPALNNQLDDNKSLIYIPAGVDDKFPLGYAGKIIEKTINADGTVGVKVEDAGIEDVLGNTKSPETVHTLNQLKLVGAIVPGIANANVLKSTKRSKSAKVFAKGAVIYEPRSKSFLGSDEIFEAGTIKLNHKIDLVKLVDSVEDVHALGNLSLNILGELSNLKITESHDIDFTFDLKKIVDVEIQQKFICEGDLTAEVAFEGIGKLKVGHLDDVWKDVEKQAFEKFGVSLDFEGLKSADKIGKIPLAGLVFSTTTYATKDLDNAVNVAQVGGIVLWVYMNLSGAITVSGKTGIGMYPHFKFGVDKEKGGQANLISEATAQAGKRVIEAPFIEGDIKLEAELGLTVEADAFVGGVRIVNAGVDIIGKLEQSFKTKERLSYGITNLGDDWSWSDGLVCQEGSMGAGAIFHADIVAGIAYKRDNSTTSLGWETHPQYPSQQSIDAQVIGWVGDIVPTWYKYTFSKGCIKVPSPATLNANHVANVRVPISEAQAKQIADENYLYAYLSNRIYDDTGTDLDVEKDGWILVDIDDGNANGFKAGLYKRADDSQTYVIAYGGTTATSSDTWIGKKYDVIIDLVTDISLLGVISISQPSNALSFYESSLSKVGSSGHLKAITGHSLGGGLAQYAGLYSGVKTVTFNTAPVPFNMLTSLPKFQDKININNAEGIMKSVHFNHEDKITNIMLPYDPISTISTAIMSLDESNVGYMMAARFLLGIPADQKMDYLITGEKIYLPVMDFNSFANFSNHSMETMEEILESNTTYNLSFDLVQDGNDINVINQQVSGAMQSLSVSQYRWEVYQERELITSGKGLDTLSRLEAGEYTIKVFALLPNALWVSSKKEIVVEAVGDVNLAHGLVAHYEFEGNANDSSGNGNHGVEYGGVGYVDGVIGQAGSFDGVDDYIKIPFESIDNEITISTWIKVENKNQCPSGYGASIIANSPDDGVGYNHTLQLCNGFLKPIGFLEHTLEQNFNTSVNINNSTWIHILYIIKKSENIKLYVDGKLKQIFPSGNFINNNEGYLTIADIRPERGLLYQGKIDDLRIYNRPLNASEIEELYSWKENLTNGNMYFVYNNSLYATDSKSNTTKKIKSFHSLYGSDGIYRLKIDKYYYFMADDGIYGRELWKTDGTAAGTTMIKDINPGNGSSLKGYLVKLNNILYFSAINYNTGNLNKSNLWRSDGTSDGTYRIKNFSAGHPPEYFIVNDNILYFISRHALWKSDGTEMGTVLIKDFYSYENSHRGIRFLGFLNNELFFSVNDGIHGQELWKTDTTNLGTVIVKDINLGDNSSNPSRNSTYNMASINQCIIDGYVYFIADDGVHGKELWKTDGTNTGTIMLTNILEEYISDLVCSKKKIFFKTKSGLIKSNGDVNDNVTILENSHVSNLYVALDFVFFNTIYNGYTDTIWRTDGTLEGTINIDLGSTARYRTYFLNEVNNNLLFIHRNFLWKSKGTLNDTEIIKSLSE